MEVSSQGDWGFQPGLVIGSNDALSGINIIDVLGGDLNEATTDETFNERFRETTSLQYRTSSTVKNTSRDDTLLCIVSDYERWVYPVYNLTDELVGVKKEKTKWEKPKSSHHVEVGRLERPTPTSRTWYATNCATPRYKSIIDANLGKNDKLKEIVLVLISRLTGTWH